MSSDIELYSNAACPYAQRVRISLLEKGLDFTFKEIDLSNRPDWFLAASPTGKVPVLLHNSNRLYESAIINEYIDEVWTAPPLMPSDPGLRAQARIWIDGFSAFARAVFYIGIRNDAQELAAQRNSLATELHNIEVNGLGLHKEDGPFWFGPLISLVDINIYPFIERMPMVEQKVGLALGDYPQISRWFTTMSARSSVIATARTAEQHIESFANLSQIMASRAANRA